MGEKAKKIAWIVFSVIFIGFMAVMFADLLGFGRSAHKQMSSTMSGVNSTNLSNYDGTSVQGSEVISAISNIKTLGGDLKLYVEVKTKSGSDVKYGYDGANFVTYNAKDSTDSAYINSTASFKSVLEYNANGVVEGLVFTQE